MIPGEYLLADEPIVANAGRRTAELTVANTGDRPIQVGSHFHFFEADRKSTRLNSSHIQKSRMPSSA